MTIPPPDREAVASSRDPPESDAWLLALRREILAEVESSLSERLRRANAAADAPPSSQLAPPIVGGPMDYGPLATLAGDHLVSDILINGPRQVFIEKRGQLLATEITFRDEGHLLEVVRGILAAAGWRLDERSPILDLRLPDGSRLNLVVKPLALNGPLVSIRRFGARPLLMEDLLANGSLAPEMAAFLQACVHARVNIIISGGAGSGKTTLLNCLSRYISHAERVATIEDTAELHLQQPHVVMMEARGASGEAPGSASLREVVRNALRMRPDRIIVGECRGAEVLDMLQAMNTGHEEASPRFTRIRRGMRSPAWS